MNAFGLPGRRDNARVLIAVKQAAPGNGKISVLVVYSIHGSGYRLPALLFWKEGQLPRMPAQAGKTDTHKPYCLLQTNG